MPLPTQVKKIARLLAPPFLYEAALQWKRTRQPDTADLKYVPNGWQEAASYRGWNVESVLEAYRATWPRLVSEAQTTDPFNLVMGSSDVVVHNTVLCFAYSAALAAQQKPSLSMLDWGGAIDQYKLLAQAALPGVAIDYHCKDVPLLAEYGQSVNPEAHFYSDEQCLEQSYDFVLASSSLQYSEDWPPVFGGLAQATRGYFLLTRAPVHEGGPSYVFSQRAYGSEWLGWSVGRAELMECARAAGLTLVREFTLSSEISRIVGAPHPSQQHGFLFRSGAGPPQPG